jgi:O-succinylbenzoic acid--CoA ligase
VVRCLIARKTVVLLPRFEPNAVLFHLERHRATLASVVPVMLHALLDADRDQVLRSLRAVLCGGAATPQPLIDRAQQHGVNVLLTYGLTEACSQVTVQSLAEPTLLRTGSGSPIAGMQLQIRTAEGALCAPGHVGNIWISGTSMMTGYVGKAALCNAWFDTGDIGELSQEGVLTVHARRMDLIITGGENVYPLEVEQALLAYPKVSAAVVFGNPHPQWGATVAAALVVHPDFEFSALWESICQHLAAFKRPRLWAKVLAIPELPNGKVDRRRAVAEFTPLLAQSMPQV